MEDQKNKINNQLVELYDRQKLKIVGAVEVVNSSDSDVLIKMENSYMFINGEGMTIIKLDPENRLLEVKGKINLISYQNKLQRKSFFKRVFK